MNVTFSLVSKSSLPINSTKVSFNSPQKQKTLTDLKISDHVLQIAQVQETQANDRSPLLPSSQKLYSAD